MVSKVTDESDKRREVVECNPNVNIPIKDGRAVVDSQCQHQVDHGRKGKQAEEQHVGIVLGRWHGPEDDIVYQRRVAEQHHHAHYHQQGWVVDQ